MRSRRVFLPHAKPWVLSSYLKAGLTGVGNNEDSQRECRETNKHVTTVDKKETNDARDAIRF